MKSFKQSEEYKVALEENKEKQTEGKNKKRSKKKNYKRNKWSNCCEEKSTSVAIMTRLNN